MSERYRLDTEINIKMSSKPSSAVARGRGVMRQTSAFFHLTLTDFLQASYTFPNLISALLIEEEDNRGGVVWIVNAGLWTPPVEMLNIPASVVLWASRSSSGGCRDEMLRTGQTFPGQFWTCVHCYTNGLKRRALCTEEDEGTLTTQQALLSQSSTSQNTITPAFQKAVHPLVHLVRDTKPRPVYGPHFSVPCRGIGGVLSPGTWE